MSERLLHDPALAFADARAPRYTSYPTAVQFTPAVGAVEQATWLAALPHEASVSLYVHVPYCRRLCWYCGCNTRVVNARNPVADYRKQLLREVDLVAGEIGRPLTSRFIHLGGGSPDVLSKGDLYQLFDRLRRHFVISADAEIAAELDPANVKAAWVRAAADNGLNRASLGVQTFAPHVQEAINRVQSPAVVENAVAALRANGVHSINFDLMYGLPLQTTADVLSTVDRALQMQPDRLAVFGYAHVPWVKKHQSLINAAELPGVSERLAQSHAAAERLLSAGYVQIGLDHFAVPHDPLVIARAQGRLRRNFQGYTTDNSDALLGFGPSAISRFPQGYVQNSPAARDWSAAVSSGRLAAVRGVKLTNADRLRWRLIERLLCEGRLDTASLEPASFGPAGVGALDILAGYERDGFLLREGPELVLSDMGWPLARVICTALDATTKLDSQHHSQAV